MRTAADSFIGSDLWHLVERMRAELRAETAAYLEARFNHVHIGY